MPSIQELRERMAQLNSRGAKKPQDLWKPKDEHEVRLVPYPGHDDPFVELHFHYEIGDVMSVLCPKLNSGDECSICTFCDLLKSWKDSGGKDKPEHERKADWELFKKLQPKARVFVPMVERGKEAEGTRWWGLTPNQVTGILEICTDSDCLEMVGLSKEDDKRAILVVTGAEKAFDLKVSFAKPGEKGNTKNWAQITIKGKIKPSPLMPDKLARQKLLDSVKNINDVYPRISSSEVTRIMERFIGKGKPEAKPEGGTEYGTTAPRPPANSGEKAAVGGRSIDDAFDEILKEGV